MVQDSCIVCERDDARIGVLCEACRADLAVPIAIGPEQIRTNIAEPCGDALVDPWGRVHPLAEQTLIGRAINGQGIEICDTSASRHHAHLIRTREGWRIRDLGSTNSTCVNDTPVSSGLLVHGDRIAIGSIGFYLVFETDASSPTASEPLETVDEECTEAGLPNVAISISTTREGGVLEIGGDAVPLDANQIRFVSALAERMSSDAHRAVNVRGFVQAPELIALMNWEAADREHDLAQLFKEMRRQFVRAGFGDLIEVRPRIGYRLRVVPAR